ncbi:hypothetical protein GCM10027073_28830 [Streptomyces chlorus]|uniref:Uncharacterized protein n=1 Tax=Streptomyces chlorus TaxID=887452 RepID=A0ABW1E6I4_9ACTN
MIHPVFESWVNKSHAPPREQAKDMMPVAAGESRTHRVGVSGARLFRASLLTGPPPSPGICTGRRVDGVDMPPSTPSTAGGMLS